MVKADDLQRARLIIAVEQERSYITTDIEHVIRDMQLPPPHRISLLLNSVAWHERRQNAEQRVQELQRELKRLQQKLGPGHPEYAIYELLQSQLNFPPDPKSWTARVLATLPLSKDQQEQWIHHTRLLAALTAVEVLQILTRSVQLRDAIIQQGGMVRWQ